MQVMIVAGCVAALSQRRALTRPWTEHARTVAALIVMPFLVLALYSAVGGVTILRWPAGRGGGCRRRWRRAGSDDVARQDAAATSWTARAAEAGPEWARAACRAGGLAADHTGRTGRWSPS